MASAAVFTHGLRGLARVREEAIDEGGFADAGGAEQGYGLPREAVGSELVEAVSAESADSVDGDAGSHLFHGADAGRWVGAEVEFVEDDDRRGAALPGRGEVALDAAGAEVVVEAGDEEGAVEVGGEDLLAAGFSGGAAGEAGGAGQNGEDLRDALIRWDTQGDPIPGDGQASRRSLVAQTAGELCTEVAGFDGDGVEVVELLKDAAGDEPGGSIGGECGVEPLVPAQHGKLHLSNLRQVRGW